MKKKNGNILLWTSGLAIVALAVTACSSDDESDDNSGATGGAAGMGGSGGSADGSTGGSGSSGGSGGSTGGSGGSTGGMGGSSGSTNGPPAGCWNGDAECNPVSAEPCVVSSGATCDFGKSGQGTMNLMCFPAPNTQQLNESCDVSDGPWCAAGMSCVPVGSDSICRPFCCENADCTEAGETCQAFDASEGTLGICMGSSTTPDAGPDAEPDATVDAEPDAEPDASTDA